MTQRVGMKKGGNKNQEKSGNNNVGFGFAWTPLETFNGWFLRREDVSERRKIHMRYHFSV